MFFCKRCDVETRDGATCSLCAGQFDFPCAGITETGWRKLGERKSTWKCSSCKNVQGTSPRSVSLKTSPIDSESIMVELKRLSTQMEVLPTLVESIKSFKAELSDLHKMRAEFSDVKLSLEFISDKMDGLLSKVFIVEQEIDKLKKTQDEVSKLQDRIRNVEIQYKENEQRSRLNNIEIKGVPVSNSENLYHLISKIGEVINFQIPKEQINYIARIPTRNDKKSKNIICSLHNSYMKSDFVAAAKKHKNINVSHLGFPGTDRIYINDHLTLDNKVLLNKTKAQARERGFEYVWVKSCRIFIRKNQTSPMHHIKSELDLKNFFH